MLVGAGIFLSRIAGLVRERVFAHYFGNSAAADAFKAAFRIPNFLQNLFGEGVLSASFIPVYAGLLAHGRHDDARRVASAIFTILALVVSVFVLIGVVATPVLIDLIAPGFTGAKRDLTINLVRIFFPGAGLLVLSAWCLGILNSHRRFFLSYTAPVLWNAVLIGALLVYGGSLEQFPLAEAIAWASVVGSLAQLLVQLPLVLRLARGLRPELGRGLADVRTVLRNFLPAFMGRGVVQISAYIDNVLASLLPHGAVAALGYAQTLYTLPVSLFGMAISAAELPAMSSAVGDPAEVAAYLRGRLDAALRRVAFFIVPSSVAFIALGDVIAGAIYQSGAFTRADSEYVWIILAGSAVGLLASTLGRLYSSTYYALRDTRTPLRYAIVRVVFGIALGFMLAIPVVEALGLERRLGVAGLTIASGIAGWLEFALLRRRLNERIGVTGVPMPHLFRLWAAAAIAAGAAWGVKIALGAQPPILLSVVVLLPYGIIYLAAASMMNVREAQALAERIRGLVSRGRGNSNR